MMTKSLLSKGEINRQVVKEQKNVKRQGFLNLSYSDRMFTFKGSTYKILARRSHYPYSLVRLGKKVNFTNHKTGQSYYKWVKLTGWFTVANGYSVGTSRTLKVPNGQWRENHKPAHQTLINHAHIRNDFIGETDFKGRKNKEIIVCSVPKLLCESPKK